jgi:hypothetical protein
MSEKIHISKLICGKLSENQRSIAWLAQKVGRNKSSFGKLLKKYSINTQLLFEISIVIRFDFFSCYSKVLPFFVLEPPNLPNSIEIEYLKLEYEKQGKIHVGKLICHKSFENQRSVAWLAQKVGRNRSSFGRLLKKDSIDTALLFEISIALQFDFFSCCSEILRDVC